MDLAMLFNTIQFTPSIYTPFMHTAQLDVGGGIELCVEVGGNPQNPPILLIMGLGAQLLFWPDDFIEKLIEAGFFVIRFDNRDIGLSTKIKIKGMPKVNQPKLMARLAAGLSNKHEPVAYNLFDMAKDTANLIDKLGIAPCYVLGASMGGMIAQILAAKYPEKVAQLALIFTSNNQPLARPPKPKQFFTLLKRPKSLQEDDLIAHSIWFMSCIGSPDYLNKQHIATIAKKLYDRSFYPRGFTQQFNAILATGSLKKYDKHIKAPTLVLHGSKDGLIPIQNGRMVAKAIPQAIFHELTGMGHDLPPHFQPDIVTQLKTHYDTHTH